LIDRKLLLFADLSTPNRKKTGSNRASFSLVLQKKRPVFFAVIIDISTLPLAAEAFRPGLIVVPLAGNSVIFQ